MTRSESSSVSNGRAPSSGARPTAVCWLGRLGQSTSAHRKRSNILDIRSRLEPTDWDIVIGPTRHAYFTVRMADGLRVVDGGKIMDADGHSTVQDINANSTSWVDMSATGPHGHEVGVTVVAHPSPLPTGWYAHEWGTVAVNPFLHEEQSIRRGETLELAVTAIAHDGPCLP